MCKHYNFVLRRHEKLFKKLEKYEQCWKSQKTLQNLGTEKC